MRIALLGTGIMILAAMIGVGLNALHLANQAILIGMLILVVVGFIIQLIGLATIKPPRFF